MYKENFASFLKKIAQNILQSSKKEQKIVCSFGQKWTKFQVDFSLQKKLPTQQSVHECQLNGKISVPTMKLLKIRVIMILLLLQVINQPNSSNLLEKLLKIDMY